MSKEEMYRVNWPEAFDYMQTLKDPVAKNLIRLVYQAIVVNDLEGVRPAAPFDLLYCFQMLYHAFTSEPNLKLALDAKGSDESEEG